MEDPHPLLMQQFSKGIGISSRCNGNRNLFLKDHIYKNPTLFEIQGMFTAKGFSVRSLTLVIWNLRFFKASPFFSIPAKGLRTPSPPALETAAASSAVESQSMAP